MDRPNGCPPRLEARGSIVRAGSNAGQELVKQANSCPHCGRFDANRVRPVECATAVAARSRPAGHAGAEARTHTTAALPAAAGGDERRGGSSDHPRSLAGVTRTRSIDQNVKSRDFDECGHVAAVSEVCGCGQGQQPAQQRCNKQPQARAYDPSAHLCMSSVLRARVGQHEPKSFLFSMNRGRASLILINPGIFERAALAHCCVNEAGHHNDMAGLEPRDKGRLGGLSESGGHNECEALAGLAWGPICQGGELGSSSFPTAAVSAARIGGQGLRAFSKGA